MKGDRLYDVIAFILNEASEQELEVVRTALKRRIEGGGEKGAMGMSPERMARSTASSINEQLGMSLEQIRSMVARFAVDIIKKDAPELSEAQVRELLDSWIPGATGTKKATGTGRERSEGAEGKGRAKTPKSPAPAKGAKAKGAEQPPQGGGPAKGSARGRSGLAPDVVLTMVTQFLAYSDESMSVTEQVKLNQEIPDWQRRYWEQFSPRIRELLSLHLKGQIDRATCLERVCADLGIDADLSS